MRTYCKHLHAILLRPTLALPCDVIPHLHPLSCASRLSFVFKMSISQGVGLFSLIGFNDLFDLCRDTDELRILFIKIGIAR